MQTIAGKQFQERSSSGDPIWQRSGSGSEAQALVDLLAPSNPTEGYLWFNESVGELYVYVDAVGWVQTNTGGAAGGGGASVSTDTEAPAGPTEGDLWFDTSVAKLYAYVGTVGWVQTNGGSGGGGEGASVSTGTEAPAEPTQGDLWFDENIGSLFVYIDGTGWTEANPGGGGGGGANVEYLSTPEVVFSYNPVGGVSSPTSPLLYDTYQTYNIPASIPSDAGGIIVRFESRADEHYLEMFAKTSSWSERRVCRSDGRNNSDDSASDVNTFIIPYSSTIDVRVLWSGGGNEEAYFYVDGYITGGGGGASNIFAYGKFDGTQSNPSASNCFGVSSITKNGTGQYVINFDEAQPDTNYVFIGSINKDWGQENFYYGVTYNADSILTYCKRKETETYYDNNDISFIILRSASTALTTGDGTSGGDGGSGPRAYATFNGAGADLTASITNSLNVTSITDGGTGRYYINLESTIDNPVVVASQGPRSGTTTGTSDMIVKNHTSSTATYSASTDIGGAIARINILIFHSGTPRDPLPVSFIAY